MSNEQDIKKQCSFDRKLYNEREKGAYFTDHIDCHYLSNLFQFPTDEPVCVLEPSIGDGSAVSIVCGKQNGANQNVNIFGVEIDKERFNVAKANSAVNYCIEGDFLQGTKITNNAFSFCFANPPYGESMLGERLEKVFLRKIDNYLMGGAILAFVVPYYIFVEDENLCKMMTNRYNVLAAFKFHDFTYKQVCIIGIKKGEKSVDFETANKLYKSLSNIDELPLIPTEAPPKRLSIMPSNPDKIKTFEGSEVSLDDILQVSKNSNLFEFLVNRTQIKNQLISLGRPPVTPSAEHLYLTSVCGAGNGKMGSEESGDLHLQRGSIISGVSKTHEKTPGGKVVEKVRHFKKSVVTIIQNNGEITVFK